MPESSQTGTARRVGVWGERDWVFCQLSTLDEANMVWRWMEERKEDLRSELNM